MDISDLPTDIIDVETFSQILDMDDDDEREFSKQIVEEFMQQAKETMDSMDETVESEDLLALSKLGHYMKGSSAALGLRKVKDECEKIQNCGEGRDPTGLTQEPDVAVSWKQVKEALGQLKVDYIEAEAVLKKFYNFSD